MVRATQSHIIDVLDDDDSDDEEDELMYWKKLTAVKGMVAPLSVRRRFRFVVYMNV